MANKGNPNRIAFWPNRNRFDFYWAGDELLGSKREMNWILMAGWLHMYSKKPKFPTQVYKIGDEKWHDSVLMHCKWAMMMSCS